MGDNGHIHQLEVINGPVKMLRCAECGTPFAEVQHGALVIRAKHHGAVHVNVIALSELALLMAPPPLSPPSRENAAIDSGA